MSRSARPRSSRSASVAALCLLALAALVLAALPRTSLSGASFTAAPKSNPSNTFTAAASFQSQVASGTYTGNNVDNRSITGLSFQPNFVIVKATTNQGAVMRTSTMTGDVSKPLFGASALANNRIQAFLSNGFQIGNNATVNQNGTTFQWFAGTTDPGTVAVGTYTGNGSASRGITGLGFSPEAVMMLSAGGHAPVMRLSPMTSSMQFDSGTGIASAVNSLDANGFTVGNNNSANQNGTAYHWVAFSDTNGLIDVGSYTGNGAASRSITGVGFSPAMTIVRGTNTSGTARSGIWRASGAMSGTASAEFAAVANDTTAITAFGADGFTVGADTNANASANGYAYLAIDQST